jgi:hypothetical protein
MRRFAPILAAVLLFSACDTYHFLMGTWKEDSRQPVEALKHYEKFLAMRPKDPRACEVDLRAAAIYRDFGRCDEARRTLESAARDFPRQPECVTRAKRALLSCPDYFPLDRGRTWVYGDTASGGRAMREEWEVRRATASRAGTVLEALFAGNRRIRVDRTRYSKADWAVWRGTGTDREPILRYPFAQGQSWSARRGKRLVEWTIVSADAAVKTRAGSYTGCLKVREYDHRVHGAWRYDYYCPGVGRVKTTVGGPGYENPNTELLRFDKMD